MMDRHAHWQGLYTTKEDTALSWFQARPTTSLKLIQELVQPGSRVVDVGGGTSRLVDNLVDWGYRVTVLDIAEAALATSSARLGDRAGQAEWVATDVTKWRPQCSFDLWHDRAVFHFLTDGADRSAYAAVMSGAVKSGGYAVIGTFTLNGPERCSGLPVCRYDPVGLATEFIGFELIEALTEDHRTPGGNIQNFQFSILRRF